MNHIADASNPPSANASRVGITWASGTVHGASLLAGPPETLGPAQSWPRVASDKADPLHGAPAAYCATACVVKEAFAGATAIREAWLPSFGWSMANGQAPLAAARSQVFPFGVIPP